MTERANLRPTKSHALGVNLCISVPSHLSVSLSTESKIFHAKPRTCTLSETHLASFVPRLIVLQFMLTVRHSRRGVKAGTFIMWVTSDGHIGVGPNYNKLNPLTISNFNWSWKILYSWCHFWQCLLEKVLLSLAVERPWLALDWPFLSCLHESA